MTCPPRDSPGPLLARVAEIIDTAVIVLRYQTCPRLLSCKAQIRKVKAAAWRPAQAVATRADRRGHATLTSPGGFRNSSSWGTIGLTFTSFSSGRTHTTSLFECSWIGASRNGGCVRGSLRLTDARAIAARPLRSTGSCARGAGLSCPQGVQGWHRDSARTRWQAQRRKRDRRRGPKRDRSPVGTCSALAFSS